MNRPHLVMSVRDVADLTGWARRQVWGLARDGTLSAIRVGRRVYFNRQVIEAFLGSTAPEPPRADPDAGRDLRGEKDKASAAPPSPRLFEVLTSALALSREDRAALRRLLQSEGPAATR